MAVKLPFHQIELILRLELHRHWRYWGGWTQQYISFVKLMHLNDLNDDVTFIYPMLPHHFNCCWVWSWKLLNSVPWLNHPAKNADLCSKRSSASEKQNSYTESGSAEWRGIATEVECLTASSVGSNKKISFSKCFFFQGDQNRKWNYTKRLKSPSES